MFSFVFRALGSDDLVVEILAARGISTGWEIMTFVMVLVFLADIFTNAMRDGRITSTDAASRGGRFSHA